ncbi:hypothetical protein [Flavobacterium sp. 120]|nr:hypothetical protein [Flavobacterium sp. 120]RKS15787.1 hypothetical protein C8C87_3150 [Flavobacterium sp. 120]
MENIHHELNMRNLHILIILFPFFISSCATSPYLVDYEPINIFLKSENISNKEYYILRNKENNIQTLRIFNRGKGKKHVVYPNEIDYTSTLFEQKYWNKLFHSYSKDTIQKYWKEEDLPGFKFINENRIELFNYNFLIRYPKIEKVIVISEPIYYHNKKYILFLYSIDVIANSSKPQIVVVMKRDKRKWILVEKIGDYNCSGCL